MNGYDYRLYDGASGTRLPFALEAVFSTTLYPDKKNSGYVSHLDYIIENADVDKHGIPEVMQKEILKRTSYVTLSKPNENLVQLDIKNNRLYLQKDSLKGPAPLPWSGMRAIFGETLVFPAMPPKDVSEGDVWEDTFDIAIREPAKNLKEKLRHSVIGDNPRNISFFGIREIGQKKYAVLRSSSEIMKESIIFKVEGYHLFDIEAKVMAFSVVDVSGKSTLEKRSGYKAQFLHFLKKIGHTPHDLAIVPQPSDKIKMATLTVDFLRQWEGRSYDNIEKYFQLDNSYCDNDKVRRVLNAIIDVDKVKPTTCLSAIQITPENVLSAVCDNKDELSLAFRGDKIVGFADDYNTLYKNLKSTEFLTTWGRLNCLVLERVVGGILAMPRVSSPRIC